MRLCQEVLLQEALLQEALLQEALLQEALLQEALLQEALLQEVLLQEALVALHKHSWHTVGSPEVQEHLDNRQEPRVEGRQVAAEPQVVVDYSYTASLLFNFFLFPYYLVLILGKRQGR